MMSKGIDLLLMKGTTFMSNDCDFFNQINMPSVEVPVISAMRYHNSLYVQINVQSWVFISPTKLEKYRGFLFEVSQINTSYFKNSFLYQFYELFGFSLQKIPTVKLASKFPLIYHPHFKNTKFGSEWVEPDVNAKCDNLGHYILKIANSLQYRDAYIFRNGNIANSYALNWYLKHFNRIEYFPSDDLQLPSLKNFEIQKEVSTPPKQPKKFEMVSNNNDGIQPVTNNSEKRNRQPDSTPESKPRKKFEVLHVSPAYSPREKKNTFILHKVVKGLSSDFRGTHKEDSHILYLAKQAFEGISTHIAWGSSTSSKNRVEQGGLLLGHTYIDPETKQLFGIAEQSVAGKLAKGSGAYLEMTHETWKEMLDVVDDSHPELQIVGWYHTHPNGLDVFMSGTDTATQARVFGNDWQFAIVLNPQKKIWRSFYGSHSKECRGHVISDKANESNDSEKTCEHDERGNSNDHADNEYRNTDKINEFDDSEVPIKPVESPNKFQ